MRAHGFKLVLDSGIGVAGQRTGPPFQTQGSPGETGQSARGVFVGRGGCGCEQTVPFGVDVMQMSMGGGDASGV
jgi:hypothetical protein